MLFFLLFALSPTAPQVDLAAQFEAHIRFLAHDQMGGRFTGATGQRIAAQYLASQMRLAGLQGPFADAEEPFIQPITLYETRLNTQKSFVESKRRRNTERMEPYRDFWPLPIGLGDFSAQGELAFVGLGYDDNTYSDLKSVDLQDKWVAVLTELPEVQGGPLQQLVAADAVGLRLRVMMIMTRGARGVILLTNETQGAPALGAASRMTLEPAEENDTPRKVIMVPQHSWAKLFGKDYDQLVKARESLVQTGQPASFVSDQEISAVFATEQAEIKTENVAALIPGHDPEVGHETIVVSAHYDHIGIAGKGVYNGADDNGTGTSMLLLLAEAMRESKPRRSILFLWVTGEENGLLGSKYFIKNPPFERSRIVANVNMDMLGRNDPNSIGIVPARVKGISTLGARLKAINAQQDQAMTLIEDFDQYNSRSDHYSFLKEDIPALFLFSGLHDDYHDVGDDWQKLDYQKLVRLHKLLKVFLLDIANAKAAPTFVEP